MNYDNDRIDDAVNALKDCTEAEALAAWYAYQRDMKTRGPGRPRGKAKLKTAPTVAEMDRLITEENAA